MAGDGNLEHAVVPHEEWLRARSDFLIEEKGFTRARDALSRARRELPWEKVEKSYVFDTPEGQATLIALTPKGRDEDGPEGSQAWVRRHDAYED